MLTTDALVESVHFLPGDRAASIARKALGVNVSDLAAKGAEPSGISPRPRLLPEDWTEEWLVDFAPAWDGRSQISHARSWGAIRCKTKGTADTRSNSDRRGSGGRDRSGERRRRQRFDLRQRTIGDAALGLDPARNPGMGREPVSRRARCISPIATCIRNRAIASRRPCGDHASAAMDVSDGLAGDLAKMMRASGNIAPSWNSARSPLRLRVQGRSRRSGSARPAR